MHILLAADFLYTISYLDLTGTLLQSIMTVTQRRGVLVKEECID